jgi:hypothetical protein
MDRNKDKSSHQSDSLASVTMSIWAGIQGQAAVSPLRHYLKSKVPGF